MAISSHASGHNVHHAADAAGTMSGNGLSVLKMLTQAGRTGLQKARQITRAIQKARMLSTLYSMSDEQLARIGIARSDIRSYAETLMVRDDCPQR